ncbi:MAG: DUF2905 domain-containing protein [Pseudobdellovibrio sp.]
MQIDPVTKIFIIIGAMFICCGIAWQFGWLQSIKIGRLPGDIRIEREGFSFYFPLTTCVLISIIIGLINWLFKK